MNGTTTNGYVTNPYLAHLPQRQQVVNPLDGWQTRKVTGPQVTKVLVSSYIALPLSRTWLTTV